MITRFAFMFVVLGTLCGAAFTLGSASAGGRQDPTGIPSGHPVVLALRFQRELALTDAQIQALTALRDQMGTEFAPLREQAELIQHNMQTLQQGGSPDPVTATKLQREGEALGEKMRPLFERYAQQVGKILTDEQRQTLTKLSDAAGKPSDDKAFVLNAIISSRDQLGITPRQFTKLQYLQADFIRAFAPIRERMELLQMEVRSKFGNGQNPPAEYAERGAQIQREFAALQSRFSDQAIRDVLEPQQRAKLEELLHGERRSTPNER